jgi:uncharacterized membrane-anchored protein YhcB (DUF1043 family)
MSGEAITALLLGLGGLLTAAISAVIMLLNTKHKNEQERERSAVEHYREIADRQRLHVERLEQHLAEQSDVISQMYEEHSACQVHVADLYGYLHRMHDTSVRLATLAGMDPAKDVPPMPQRPRPPDREAREFRLRSLRQTTSNLKQLSGVIATTSPAKPPPEDPQS